MNTRRNDEFHWLRWPDGTWTIGQWNSRTFGESCAFWQIIGSDDLHHDEEFAEIGIDAWMPLDHVKGCKNEQS